MGVYGGLTLQLFSHQGRISPIGDYNKVPDLTVFFPHCQDAEVVRSRDSSVLADCDVVVDVGGQFDPSRHLYDHHQRYTFHSVIFIKNGGHSCLCCAH